MRRLDIKVGFSCNNRCVHCVQGDKRSHFGDKSLKTIQEELIAARKTCDTVVITGGEPTIRPDFLSIVDSAKKTGYQQIQIQSNGRLFAYRAFVEKTIEAGANEFGLALHGHVPALHDYLTGVEGSFNQTVTGIRLLKRMGQHIVMNSVITKSNYRNLPNIAQLLVQLGVDQYQFAFVHALGSAAAHFERVVPRKALVIPYLQKGLAIGIAAHKRVMAEAMPYCCMKGYEEYVAERVIPQTTIYDFKQITEEFEKVRVVEGKAKTERCKQCYYYAICEGPWKEYPERFGWDEFEPVLKID